MTDILLDWLNKEVNLSKQIKNIGEDFASGYLFGELLHKFKEISNFSEYQNKSESDTRIKNLKLVEKAFRDLGIKIDKERINDISDCKKGVAARFLFQIKMKLSQKGIDFDNLMMKNSTQLYDLYKSIQYPNQNDKYLIDAKNRSSNRSNLTGMSKSGLSDSIKNAILPENNIEQKIFEEISKDENYFKRESQIQISKINGAERDLHSEKLQKDGKEIKTWQASLKHKNEFETKQNEYLMKDAVNYRNEVLQSLKSSQLNAEIQIDSFDKTLEKLGLDIAVIDPKLKKPSKNLMSSEIILQKIRDKLAMDLAAKKERERRKRKINVDQTRAQNVIEKKKEEIRRSMPISNNEMKVDLFSSVHEKRLEYENWRNLHSLNEKAENKRQKLEKLIRDETIIDRDFSSLGISDTEPTAFNKEVYFSSLRRENFEYRTLALEKKKIKREKNITISSNILTQILDIVDECYIYQKTKSEELIEVKEWKNWMQSFIEDGSLKMKRSNMELGFDKLSSKETRKTQSFENDTAHEIFNNTTTYVFSEYEEMELFNYIYFKGRWNKSEIPESIFSKKINVRDVLDIDYLYKLYGNKTKSTYRNLSDKAFNIELRDEDIETLTIPRDNTKNYLFGEIIDIVTEIKFSFYENNIKNNNSQVGSSMFSYIPVKLCLIGHSFSGKSTQAKLLTDNYSNIKVYEVDSLIKKSIENLERLEIPLEANSKYKTFKKTQLEQLEKEREIELEKFKEIRKLITPIRDALKQNEKVRDEYIVNFVLEYLRKDFPEKDPYQVTDEILKKYKKKKEITEELAKIKEEQIKKPKLKVKEEQQLISDLAKINLESNRGFVIIDFPKNIEQAKILEYKLTGYTQEIDKPKSQLQEYRDNFSILTDRLVRTNPQLQIRESGLDMVVCLDVNSKECIRRSTGRRIDPSNGNIYHIEDNPAPVNDNKLRDRLQLFDDGNSEQQLKIKHLEFDRNIGGIKEFYELFGIQKYSLKCFNQINGENQKLNIYGEIMEYVTRLKKISEDKENEVISFTKIDKNTGYLGNVESSYNVLNINTPKSNPGQTFNLNVVSNNPSLIQFGNNQPDAKELDVIIQTEDEENNKFSKKVEDARRKLSLNTIETMFYNWKKILENYTSEAKIVFQNIKKQKDLNLSTFSKFQTKFLNFLKRPSKKLVEVTKYQTKFNNFGEEYAKLRDDPQVKQEFHKDVTALTEKIWEIIETRKNEAIEERLKVMNSGKIEKEMEMFFLNIKRLFSIEIEKFLGSIQIIRDFYVPQELPRNFNQLDLTSLTNFLNLIKISEFIPETILQIPLEGTSDKENSPRLEKLFHNCLKLIFVLDERLQTIDKNIKSIFQGNSSPDIQSIVKKNVRTNTLKKSQIDSSFFENKIEISYDEEMKNAIKIEKNKFKFRMTLITNWGMKYVKTMRKMVNSLYDSFDDWIIDTVKSENEAMNNLISSARSHIEKESSRIKLDQIQLDGFEIYTIQDIIGYTTYSKNSIQTFSTIDLEKFRDIYNHVKSFEFQKNLIRTSTFIDVFIINYLVDSNNEGIYQTIRNLTFHNYNRFIKLFEAFENKISSSSTLSNSKSKISPIHLE